MVGNIKVNCVLCVILVEEGNNFSVQVIITRLIWIKWTLNPRDPLRGQTPNPRIGRGDPTQKERGARQPPHEWSPERRAQLL